MSELLLIRHAETVSQGMILAGRMDGVHLSEKGKAQAARLASLLRGETLDAVYSSPLERALGTAQALGFPVRIHAAFHEIDYGEWTGRTFEVLAGDDRWREWNKHRATSRIPGGESMLEVQARVVVGIESICAAYPDGRIAVVTHGDIIRAALMYYKGVPLDRIHDIEAGPASISRISVPARGLPA